jgi:uncharacterized protein YceH (UPF0502 family)
LILSATEPEDKTALSARCNACLVEKWSPTPTRRPVSSPRTLLKN